MDSKPPIILIISIGVVALIVSLFVWFAMGASPPSSYFPEDASATTTSTESVATSSSKDNSGIASPPATLSIPDKQDAVDQAPQEGSFKNEKWSGEPKDYISLSTQIFSNAILAGSGLDISDGWKIIWNEEGYGRAGTDVSAPASPPNVFEVLYPVGFEGGDAPASTEYGIRDKKNIFVGFWWKANSRWQGHQSNVNKLQFIYFSDYGSMTMVMYGPPGGPYEMRVAPQFKNIDTQWLRPNRASGIVSPGEWYKVEWLVEMPRNESRLGVIKWWLDGELVGEYNNILFPPSDVVIVEHKLSPTWGGIGDVKTQNDYFWFDEVYISAK